MLDAVMDDHLGLLRAVLILLPRDAISELKEKQVSPEDVAKLARIPEEYARLAMSEYWEAVTEGI
jgi:hypothetical protein